MNRAKAKALREAAMWLCVESSMHSMECTCGTCRAASKAAPFLPGMHPHYHEQFQRRAAVQKVAGQRSVQ